MLTVSTRREQIVFDGNDETKQKRSIYEKKFNDSINNLKWAMSLIAIYPKSRDTLSIKILWLFYVTTFTALVSASYAGDVVYSQNLEGLVAGLVQSLAVMIILVKYVLFSARIKPLRTVLETMEDDWNKLGQKVQDNWNKEVITSRCERIMSTYTRIPKIFFATYTTVTVLCWSLLILTSIARTFSMAGRTNVDMQFPMHSWYPFSSSESPVYQIVFVFEVVVGYGIVLAHTSIDGFLVTIIFHLCGQFEILRYRIEEFEYEKQTIHEMCATIKSIVLRHLAIMDSSLALRKSFSDILLVQLLGGTLHICLSGFCVLQAMNSDNVVSTIIFALLLIMTMQQMFIYSLAGEYLTSQSAALRMAAYKVDWYEMPNPISKSLLFVMTRTETPMTITAGVFYSMSLSNFTMLLKSSVSYLSVLRAMNSDKPS